LLIDSKQFAQLDETRQASFLVQLCKVAASHVRGHDGIKNALLHNAELSQQLLEGDYSVQDELLKFIEDPNMSDDFGGFYEKVKDDAQASAAVHIVSYGCAFVLRLAAKRKGVNGLPDPVLEALPDIADFYFDQAQLLGIR